MTDRTRPERKAYPRLQAPVYFAPDRRSRRRDRRDADPKSGVSVFTDEPPDEGEPLHIEIFLVDGSSVVCRAEVAWVEALGDGAPARYDVGLTFTKIRPGDRERLIPVLRSAPL
ncbi:MAG: PilZ domain-containing protein [Myxococcales bacterium]